MGDRRKSRRSSILKPPKPRNPLSDVDLNPPSIDATFMKSRRVSFANSNFIKEFTADPEKNTIWHNSYEEVVNKSEPSASSLSEDDLNITKGQNVCVLDTSLETPLLDSPLEMSICTSNIDLTSEVVAIATPITIHQNQIEYIEDRNKENEPYYNINEETMSECSMDITQTISTDIIIQSEDIDMDFTRAIPSTINLMKSNEDIVIPDGLKYLLNINNKIQDDMEFTVAVSNKIEVKEDKMNNSNMELTKAIPAHIKLLPQPQLQPQPQPQKDNDMEFTQAIPSNLKCFNTSNMPSQNQKDNDMEFTQAIPVHIKLHPQKNCFNESASAEMELTKITSEQKNDIYEEHNIQKENIDTDMELTTAIPVHIKLNPQKQKDNNKSAEMELTPNKIEEHINLEITSVTPEQKVNDDMEFTQAIPSNFKCFNKSANAEMELTEVILPNLVITPATLECPEHEHEHEQKENTDNVNDMEFTAAIPVHIKLNPQKGKNNDIKCLNESASANAEMELTKVISTQKENIDTDMELTKAIPVHIKVHPQNDNDKSVEVIPTEQKNDIATPKEIIDNDVHIKLHSQKDNDKSVKIELTPNKNINLVITSVSPKQKEKDDMEFTQAILVHIKLHPQTNNDKSTEMESIKSESESEQINANSIECHNQSDSMEISINDKNIKQEQIINDLELSQLISDEIKLDINRDTETETETNLFNMDMTMSEHDDVDDIAKQKDLTETETKNDNIIGNIFHLKGYPLIISPRINSNDASDICLRIKYPNDPNDPNDEDEPIPINISQIDINHENTKESFIGMNKSSFVDCTEKLINYQLNFNNTNKRQSTEMICNISNIPQKVVAKEDDVGEAWKSMVEKSFINNDGIWSEDVSLLNSSEPEPESDEIVTVSDFCKKILKKLKDAIELTTIPTTTNYNNFDDIDDEKIKSKVLRRRFNESFKHNDIHQQQVVKLSLEDRIFEKSKDAVWNIVEMSETYTFNFMFETIVFVIHLAENENVKKIEFYTQFCAATSPPTATYIHNIIKKKLTRNYITAALGQTYNILSLLDLITMTGEQMLNILNEFDELECRYGLVLTEDLRAQIEFFDLHLAIAFEVTININNIENVNRDDVSVRKIVGDIDENAIGKLIQGCPQNIQFLRGFIGNVEGYIAFLKSIKRKKN